MFTLMCDIFIVCFVLFLFITCFGWNYNHIAAAAAALVDMAAAAAAEFVRGNAAGDAAVAG